MMITILNFSDEPLTETQRKQVLAGVEREANPAYLTVTPRIRSIHVKHERSVEATLDGIPLDVVDWKRLPVIPWIPDGTRFAEPLLTEVNRRRGYKRPVVVKGEKT